MIIHNYACFVYDIINVEREFIAVTNYSLA